MCGVSPSITLIHLSQFTKFLDILVQCTHFLNLSDDEDRFSCTHIDSIMFYQTWEYMSEILTILC